MPVKICRTCFLALLAAVAVAAASCNKDFLEKRQSSALVIPSTIEELSKLLDADSKFKETPVMGEIFSDDFYLLTDVWKGMANLKEKNSYIWNKELYDGTSTVPDWNLPYEQILIANAVLENLNNIVVNPGNSIEWNRIKGAALFLRAYALYNVAQLFAPAYDIANPQSALGVPIRLTPNVDEPTKRSTLKETYDQILSDLNESKQYLIPEFHKTFKHRPTKLTVYALMARVYLSIRDYDKALLYADSVLLKYNTLIDFNKVSASATYPFPLANDETIYQSNMISQSTTMILLTSNKACLVDSLLFKSYDTNDLRKIIYYNGIGNVKGSYADRYRFSGFAVDELYLIRAECLARKGDVHEALKSLNTLLRSRWKVVNGQSTFKDYEASGQAEALQLILKERRKELVFRGLRWSDLRRLNLEGAGISLKRVVDGTEYTLPANDARFTAQIPPDVIALSGIEPNPR